MADKAQPGQFRNCFAEDRDLEGRESSLTKMKKFFKHSIANSTETRMGGNGGVAADEFVQKTAGLKGSRLGQRLACREIEKHEK